MEMQEVDAGILHDGSDVWEMRMPTKGEERLSSNTGRDQSVKKQKLVFNEGNRQYMLSKESY